ncbi:hypothetical protein HK100_008041, partial [Physocladia obscura]
MTPSEKLQFARNAFANKEAHVQNKEALFADWAIAFALSAATESAPLQKDVLADSLSFVHRVLIESRTKLAQPRVSPALLVAAICRVTILLPPSPDLDSLSAETDAILSLLRNKFSLRVFSRTPIDVAVSLAIDACAALSSHPSSDTLSLLVLHVLEMTRISLSANQSQKKVFQLFVSKLLVQILKLRNALISADKFKDSAVAVVIDDILTSVLFHKEHIPEYLGALQVISGKSHADESVVNWCKSIVDNITLGKSKGKASYPKLLFETIFEYSSDLGVRSCVLTAMPYLLNLFICARKKYLKEQDSNLSFSVDFEFFITLFAILSSSVLAPNNSGKKAANSLSQQNFHEAVANLIDLDIICNDKRESDCGVLGSMIRILVDQDVYKATQDQVSKVQLATLKEINELFVFALSNVTAAKHGAIFDVLGALMTVEHGIVMDSLKTLWVYLIMPHQDSKISAISFVSLLLEILTKSRETELFLIYCFDAVRGVSANEIEAFSLAISKTLPAQIPHILSMLIRLFVSSEIIDNDASDGVNSLRRRRINSPNPLFIMQDAEITIPEYVHVLSEFISRLVKTGISKITPAQNLNEQFQQELDMLFEQVIMKLINSDRVISPSSKKRTLESVDINDSAVHGLSMLLAIIQSSEQFWKRKIRTEFIFSLAKKFISESDSAKKLLTVQIALFHAECVASNSLDPKSEKSCVDLVTLVLDNVDFTKLNDKASWNGNIVDLNVNNLGVAIWASLLDHVVPV